MPPRVPTSMWWPPSRSVPAATPGPPILSIGGFGSAASRCTVMPGTNE